MQQFGKDRTLEVIDKTKGKKGQKASES
jgi:hypothetical protein